MPKPKPIKTDPNQEPMTDAQFVHAMEVLYKLYAHEHNMEITNFYCVKKEKLA
jgi:hypothetical protein